MAENQKGHCTSYDRADLLIDFVSTYYDHMNTVRDYGTGEKFTMTEVHMVSRIGDNPGITVTELARQGKRTKGAISQIVKKLEEKGLVVKEKQAGYGCRTLLFLSPKGRELNECHKRFDREQGGVVYGQLLQEQGEEAMQRFFQVMASWYEKLSLQRRPKKEEEQGKKEIG